MSVIRVKKQEAVKVRFTIQNSAGVVQDVSTVTFEFQVAQRTPAYSSKFTISNGSFDKNDAVTGIVVMPISAVQLNLNQAFYEYELRMEFATDDIRKTVTDNFVVERAITT